MKLPRLAFWRSQTIGTTGEHLLEDFTASLSITLPKRRWDVSGQHVGASGHLHRYLISPPRDIRIYQPTFGEIDEFMFFGVFLFLGHFTTILLAFWFSNCIIITIIFICWLW